MAEILNAEYWMESGEPPPAVRDCVKAVRTWAKWGAYEYWQD
ncbi:hypothetical protein [Acrocarpospora sp. B8E8]